MNKIQTVIGILCLLTAAALFVFDFSEFHLLAAATEINIYPAIVLTVVGIALVAGARRRERAGL